MLTFAISALALTCGCTSHPSGPHQAALASRSPEHSDRRTLLYGGERGLEVRQWFVPDDSDAISAAMALRGTSHAATSEEHERLRRNGLRLVRVPLDELDALEADLGGAMLRNVGWHGQVLGWQEFLSRPLHEPRALAVDGRVQLFDAGTVRLMGRAWLVQMEEGRYLTVQIVPQHYRAAPLSYYKLLGRQTGEGTVIQSMALDLLLEEGYAYVLTCESPMVDWNGETKRSTDETHEVAAMGVMPGPDLDGGAPITIGQLLLRSEHVSSLRGRGVLVFVPRIESSPEANLSGVARILRGADEAANQR